MADDDPELLARSQRYLDELFGPGAGEKHTRFLRSIDNDALRAELHRYHVIESRQQELSVEENYLIGLCVLCAVRSYGPAGMFAKTLLHRGVRKEKILEAVARLAMWIGGIPAAEAAAHVQKAIADFEARGVASLAAWFPDGR